MVSPLARYSLTELADIAGVTPRTVRYYQTQGLLPSPGASGPGAKYDDAYLDRLLLIKRLQREHLPLAEIRQRLAGLDPTAIATLAEEPAPAAPTPADDSALDYIRNVLAKRAPATSSQSTAPTPSPPPPKPTPSLGVERAQWDRVSFGPDVELHIRRPLSRPLAKKVDRLIEIARDLLEEEPS